MFHSYTEKVSEKCESNIVSSSLFNVSWINNIVQTEEEMNIFNKDKFIKQMKLKPLHIHVFTIVDC